MGKLRAESVNWISEAWAIRGAIKGISAPTPQPNGLMKGGPGPLTVKQVADLEGLQDTFRRHLRYRMSLQRPAQRPARGQAWQFTSRDPWETRRQLHRFTRIVGFEFHGGELMAVEAMRLAGFILHFRCVDESWRSELPLMVASISTPASFNAAKTRGVRRPKSKGRGILRQEIESAYWNHQGESAFDILNRLKGGVVIDAGADSVTYRDSNDKPKTITMDHYENTFSQAKKAVEARSAGGRSRR